MKERPILFSGPMVRAILEGRKTQTRRVVKTVRGYEHNSTCRPDLAADPWVVWWHGESERVGCLQECPFGAPGDRLWVREAWQVDAPRDGSWPDTMFFGDRISPLDWIPAVYRTPKHCLFRASWDGIELWWRSPIHMPRWASRLTLEVVAVRVERLQEISEADAKAEGIAFHGDQPSPRDRFSEMWDAINGTRRVAEWNYELGTPRYGRKVSKLDDSCAWAANPWVWVVEFKVVT